MTVWTDKQVERLIELVNQKMTSIEIAKILGKTRSTIMGQVRRKGLSLHLGHGKKPEKIEKPKNLSKFSHETLGPVFNSPDELSSPFNKIAGNNNACKWAVSETLWCSHPVQIGSYCEKHNDLAFDKKKRPKSF